MTRWVCAAVFVFGAWGCQGDLSYDPGPSPGASGELAGCPDFRQVEHVADSRWILFDGWSSAQSSELALVDIATGEGRCIPGGIAPVGYHVSLVADLAPSGDVRLTVLDHVDGGIVARRGPPGELEIIRTWAEGRVADLLFDDGAGVVLVLERDRDDAWHLRELDTGRWIAGPIPDPRTTFADRGSIARLPRNRWAFSNDDRIFSHPGDETILWTSDGSVPLGWDATPPLAPWSGGADEIVVLDDESLLVAGLTTVFHWQDGKATPILEGKGLLGTLAIADGRPVLWKMGSQELLEIETGDGDASMRTLWRTSGEREVPTWSAPESLDEEREAPDRVDGVLALWSEEPADWSSWSALVRFEIDHATELRVLRENRAEAIPKLIAHASWESVSALALLRAHEADPLFRERLRDDWAAPQCGRSYPIAEHAADALEHLHRMPLAEIIPLSAEEEARLTAMEYDDDDGEAYDWGWSHAGFLLNRLGKEVPSAPDPPRLTEEE